MKPILLTLAVLSYVIFQSFSQTETSASEIFTTTLEYPDNQSKSFSQVDEFYNQLDKTIYEEYKNATFNMREKIAFKEVADIDYIFNIKTNRGNSRLKNLHTPLIHPNRQVYYFGSFYQNNNEEWHKYAVIDAETSNFLLGGSHYHKYDNPFK